MSTTEQLPNGWTEIPLSDLFSFQNGANADGAAYGRGVKFANVLEVLENSHLNAKQIPGMVSVPKSTIQSFRLSRGDVLFNRTSETQDEVALASVYLDDAEAIFGGFVIRGRPKTGDIDPVWSGYGLRSDRVRKQIIAVSQGAVRANIGQDNLGKVVAWLPPVEEQRAIAGVLSDADSLIASLDALITKKRNLKHATMQQLLTGKQRLPTFTREWKVCRLGDRTKSFSGGTPPTSVARYYNGEIPWITSSDCNLGRIRSVKGRISEEGFRASAANKVSANTLLLALYGATAGVAALTLIDATINQAVLAIETPEDSPEFLFYWFTFNRSKIITQFTQGGQANLSGEVIRALELELPTPKEQHAIAEVLHDFDAEIDSLVARRQKTELLKIGLMQELLSGRRRLV